MSKDNCSTRTAKQPLGHSPQFAESGVIRFASSQKEVTSASENHPQTQWALAEYSQQSPSASVSACSSQRGIIGTLAAGYFAQRSKSSQKTASPSKPVRPSDIVSLGSETVSSLASILPSGDSTPAFLRRYWNLTAARESVLRKAAAGVRVAYESVYRDQIDLWSDFMTASVQDGLIPHQPQATPARLVQLSGKSFKDDVARLIKFVSLLPGFFDLDAGDQQTLLSAKYLVTAMLHRAKFHYRGESYTYMAGPGRIHPGAYYMEAVQVDPEFCGYMFQFAETVNDVGLTLNETYLLMAVAIFAPDHARAVHKNTLGYLHAYYLDALFYILGSRLPVADRGPAFRKLENTMKQFAMMDHISANYMNNLDLTTAPLRSRSAAFSELLTYSSYDHCHQHTVYERISSASNPVSFLVDIAAF